MSHYEKRNGIIIFFLFFWLLLFYEKKEHQALILSILDMKILWITCNIFANFNRISVSTFSNTKYMDRVLWWKQWSVYTPLWSTKILFLFVFTPINFMMRSRKHHMYFYCKNTTEICRTTNIDTKRWNARRCCFKA